MPVQFVINPRPDKREIKRYKVKQASSQTGGLWTQIYQRTHPFVQGIEVRNLSTGNMLYISQEEMPTADNFDPIQPLASFSEEMDPPYLYANTDMPVSHDIEVLVIVKYFSIEYVKRMYMGIYEPMISNPKQNVTLYDYFYGTDKVFPKIESPEKKHRKE